MNAVTLSEHVMKGSKMNISSWKNLILSLMLIVGLAGTAMAQDNTGGIVRTPQPDAELEVPLYKSRILSMPASIKRISVGSPDIADLLLLRSTELYVLGKDLGTTNVLLWDAQDVLIAVVSVEVTHDLDGLKKKLHDLMPNEAIEVRAAQRSIVLSGTVSSPTNVTAAVAIAKGYLAQAGTAKEKEMFEVQRQGNDGGSGEVINLLQVGGAQQVMLEVKVAEISRRELRKFDMRFNTILNSSRWTTGAVNGGATFPDAVFTGETEGRVPVFPGNAPWGPAVDEFAPNDLFIEDKGLFASLLTNDFLLNLTLEAAKENGLAKILAEPNLTTLSGQEAKFLSGGEFPIPVPQGDDSVTIEFKEFGVGVGFLPVVLGDGRINMVLNISVSELVNASSVGLSSSGSSSSFLVPSLTKRSANATVELRDGQTIGIAGLLNENMREVITKFPGLGDIPILGHLFRSQEFVKGETELVILVTPHLAKPMSPDDIKLPTDNFVEPTDADFYFWGRLEGSASGEQGAGGTTSDFGHDLD
jgi:pilus assembly protein CpaC